VYSPAIDGFFLEQGIEFDKKRRSGSKKSRREEP
jgi:hypothetical protein